jgi:hypothetical protein
VKPGLLSALYGFVLTIALIVAGTGYHQRSLYKIATSGVTIVCLVIVIGKLARGQQKQLGNMS